MAAHLRQGKYGSYYGSYTNESCSLTKDQSETNATYITKALKAQGWTLNAIAGLLGNMQCESALNPGRWQSERVNNYNVGYGLVQWTKATKYIDWAKANGYTDFSTMDANLARIKYEVDNGVQWGKRPSYNYNLTFKEYTQSTLTAYELACHFVYCYERPAASTGTQAQQNALKDRRGSAANTWFTFIGGVNTSSADYYIYTNGEWHTCVPLVYTNGEWKSTDDGLIQSNQLYDASSYSGFMWPLPGVSYISAGYMSNDTVHKGNHKGIDIAGGRVNIVAAYDGEVIIADSSCPHDYGKYKSCGCGGGFGRTVCIDHGMIGNQHFFTRYGHMSKVDVKVGQKVKKGQVIGVCGTTGFSTGVHLHFGIAIGNSWSYVNPTQYVSYKG